MARKISRLLPAQMRVILSVLLMMTAIHEMTYYPAFYGFMRDIVHYLRIIALRNLTIECGINFFTKYFTVPT